MTYEYGPLALAMRYGGLLLLNEIDLTAPEVAAGLNSVLDGSPLCIAENGGELITPHPLFRFAATANSNGAGDDTGLYQGVQRQNAAFLDRFILCELGYPLATVEQQLLKTRFPALPADVCDKMVSYANEVRNLFMGEATNTLSNTIEVTFSTRSLLRWAQLTLRYQPLARQGIQPVAYALDRALAYRACRETRAMLHELVQRIFPSQDCQAAYVKPKASILTGQDAIDYVHERLNNAVSKVKVQLSLTHTTNSKLQSTKLWSAEADSISLTLMWGREGVCQQTKTFSYDECRNHNTYLELERRVTDKINEGYTLNLEQSVL